MTSTVVWTADWRKGTVDERTSVDVVTVYERNVGNVNLGRARGNKCGVERIKRYLERKYHEFNGWTRQKGLRLHLSFDLINGTKYDILH